MVVAEKDHASPGDATTRSGRASLCRPCSASPTTMCVGVSVGPDDARQSRQSLIDCWSIAEGSVFWKPQYIYAVGSQLCGTSVHITDSSIDWAPSFVRCFYDIPADHDVISIGFHFYAEQLFFSDNEDGRIHRLQMEVDQTSKKVTLLTVAANTGPVKGKHDPGRIN